MPIFSRGRGGGRGRASKTDWGVALALIAIIVGVVGWGTPIVAHNLCDGTLRIYGRCNEGLGTCTIVAGASQCNQVIPYSVGYTNNPDFRYITTKPSGGFAGTQTITIYKTDYLFLATNFSLTWRNYPVAHTVWFNQPPGVANSQGFPIQQEVSWAGATTVNFEIGCDAQNPSFVNTGAEVLALQWSTVDLNTGAGNFAWNNLTTVNVSNASCGWGFPTLSQSGFISIPVGARIAPLFLQLVGWGGNGAATDAISFGWVKVEVTQSVTVAVVVTCIDGTNVLSPPKAKINVICLSSVAPPAGQTTVANFAWQAWGFLG